MTISTISQFGSITISKVGIILSDKSSEQIAHSILQFNRDMKSFLSDLENLENGVISEPTDRMAVIFGMGQEKYNHPYDGYMTQYHCYKNDKILIQTKVGTWEAYPDSNKFGNKILYKKIN